MIPSSSGRTSGQTAGNGQAAYTRRLPKQPRAINTDTRLQKAPISKVSNGASPKGTVPLSGTQSFVASEQPLQREMYNAINMNSLEGDVENMLIQLGTAYDPDRLAAMLKTKRGDVAKRALRITSALGFFLVNLASDYAAGTMNSMQQQRASELVTTLSTLGPSFVKIGQALSARPDLLPRTYLETLSQLQDSIAPFANNLAHELIERELGQPVSAIYSEFSPEPVAAASLGQVYKAKLRSSGMEVAVKVQRPCIAENIAIDIMLLRQLMGVVDARVTFISTDIVPFVDEFARRLFSELDYVQEGRNAEKFEGLYGGIARVRSPKIYWEATSQKVLTMEWIDGVKLTNRGAMAAAGLDVVDFVNVGIECTLRQLLEAGYFHADPHPGNLLATKSGDLVYLDFGMMSEAPEYARYAIIAHVVHLVNRDYEAMCQDYYTLQFVDRSVDTRPIAPRLAEFFDDVLSLPVSKLNFKAIVDGLGDVFYEYPFKVPAYYALILRSLTVLEGLALQADSEYKLLAQAYPYMARRLLVDPAPQLRGAFVDLVLQDGRVRWGRIQNLVVESSKSEDLDPASIGLVVDWLVSDTATPIRQEMAVEMGRMLDALVAEQMRGQMMALGATEDAVKKLLPVQPNEQVHLEHAQDLLALAQQRMPPQPASGPPVIGTLIRGTGPFGLPTPFEFADSLQTVVRTVQEVTPQAAARMQKPGAQQAVAKFTEEMVQRFVARSVKFGLGLQQLGTRELPPQLK